MEMVFTYFHLYFNRFLSFSVSLRKIQKYLKFNKHDPPNTKLRGYFRMILRKGQSVQKNV